MAQVVPYSAEITSLNTKIVAVSFGTPYWAGAWLKTTGAPFPIWLDPDKQSYPTYGMERSLKAAYSPKTIWYYIKAVARGEKLQKSQGDTDQLGGNFIVDKNGIVRFAYPSKDPTDRPPVADLLSVLRTLD